MRRLIFTLLIALPPTAAVAQSEPPAGVRATGMGGAFVAVADDASAVFWNPAGLASGSYFSLALDLNRLETPDNTPFPHRRVAFMLALGSPALGLSYFSTTVTRGESVATVALDGFQPAAGVIRVEHLEARHVGGTVVQSLGRYVAVGATLRAVRGSASSGLVSVGDEQAFDAAGDLPRTSTTKFDTDIGVMASATFAKAGLSVRNVFEPRFSTPDGDAITLERRIRGGVSLLLLRAVRVAADVDFTKATSSFGEWRDAAIGAEVRPGRRAWVRGGIHWNTAGGDRGPGAAPVGSVGASYAVHGSILADGQFSFGSDKGDQGWGAALRFVF